MSNILSLSKGQKLNLSKDVGISKAKIGLGWKQKAYATQQDFDLDASVFVLQEDPSTPFGRIMTKSPAQEGWICFYNQQKLPNDCVVHSGDNKTGGSVGNDEEVTVDFSRLPQEASRVVVVVTIHDAIARKQNFGQIESAHAKLYNENGSELASYQLDEIASVATAMVFVEFKKNSGGDWIMQAVGEGSNDGLESFCRKYKVPGF